MLKKRKKCRNAWVACGRIGKQTRLSANQVSGKYVMADEGRVVMIGDDGERMHGVGDDEVGSFASCDGPYLVAHSHRISGMSGI